MTVGLVVGKFAPLHRGHQLVIESARHQSDHVIVAVYDSPQFEPRVSIRAGWIGSLYPDVETLVLPDSCPKGSDTKVTAVYAKQWLALRREIATVFSSESYGERFAHEIGASHTAVDPRRRLVPVSGSSIRADPYAHRRFLEPIVYRDLVRKVCLVGAESTGKTSLAAALARHFSTCWAPEYGRELYERKRGVLDFDDLLEIAREHLRREERLRLNSRRYLFCDTNALATVFWSRFYFSRVDPELERLAQSVQNDYDYVLCAADIPYEQDGWRETGGGSEWLRHQAEIREGLERRGLAYIDARGTLAERVTAISELLS
ncbi:MAG: AAA family ATPase [Actinobacteria bacterium]|nr:AAA family ATPase [Actinomycetota bacterium]